MDSRIGKGSIISDQPGGQANEEEGTWLVLLVALAIIVVMYIYDRNFAQHQQEASQLEIKGLYWQWSYVPPAECRDAMAGDRRAFCAEHMAKARAEFEAEWSRKLASGWVPPKLLTSQADPALQN